MVLGCSSTFSALYLVFIWISWLFFSFIHRHLVPEKELDYCLLFHMKQTIQTYMVSLSPFSPLKAHKGCHQVCSLSGCAPTTRNVCKQMSAPQYEVYREGITQAIATQILSTSFSVGYISPCRVSVAYTLLLMFKLLTCCQDTQGTLITSY